MLCYFSAATCDIPDYEDFELPPSINDAVLGGTIEYGNSFSVNACDQGADDPVTGMLVTYRIPQAVRIIFPITVECVYNSATSQYVLDRGNALDCAAYGRVKEYTQKEVWRPNCYVMRLQAICVLLPP